MRGEKGRKKQLLSLLTTGLQRFTAALAVDTSVQDSMVLLASYLMLKE